MNMTKLGKHVYNIHNIYYKILPTTSKLFDESDVKTPELAVTENDIWTLLATSQTEPGKTPIPFVSWKEESTDKQNEAFDKAAVTV